MYEIYHIEFLGPQAEGGNVVRRVYVRSASVAAAKERAVVAFRRARVPQAKGPEVETVRLVDGAGYEVFSIGPRD